MCMQGKSIITINAQQNVCSVKRMMYRVIATHQFTNYNGPARSIFGINFGVGGVASHVFNFKRNEIKKLQSFC